MEKSDVRQGALKNAPDSGIIPMQQL